jgi:hypothetical protein
MLSCLCCLQAVRGTTAEPALFEADKEYSVTADITHLLPYIEPGMPTKFSLGNFVDNVFNVPVWAGEQKLVHLDSSLTRIISNAQPILHHDTWLVCNDALQWLSQAALLFSAACPI